MRVRSACLLGSRLEPALRKLRHEGRHVPELVPALDLAAFDLVDAEDGELQDLAGGEVPLLGPARRHALRVSDDRVDAHREGVEADYDFHLAICRATKNDSFEAFLEFLGRQIIPRRTVHVLRQTDRAQQAYLTKVLAEHRKIHDAITAGDSTAARNAMRSHLRKGRSRYEKLVKEEAETVD